MLTRIRSGLLAVLAGVLLALTPVAAAVGGDLFDVEREDVLLELILLGRLDLLEDLIEEEEEEEFDVEELFEFENLRDIERIVDLAAEIEELEEELEEEEDEVEEDDD